MGISDIQYLQKDIEKFKYKKMSKISLDNILNFEEMYSDLPVFLQDVFQWKTETNKDGVTEISNFIDNWLDNSRCKEIINKRKKKSIDLAIGLFENSDYHDSCLKILDLLTDKGVAMLCIPSINYKSLNSKIKENKNFHINAIFSSDDGRNTVVELDEEYLLPVNCKYLAVLVSRKKTENLYILTEYSQNSKLFDGDENGDWDDWVADYKNFINNKLQTTPKKQIYKRLISNERVIVNKSDFSDINSFYIDSEIYGNLHGLINFQQVTLSDVSRNIASNPVYIRKFLECFGENGEPNPEKWNLIVEDSNQFVNNDLENEELFESIHKQLNEEQDTIKYISKTSIKNIEQVIILETYYSKYAESKHMAYHPFNWRVGEYKHWMWSDDLLTFALLILEPDKLLDRYFLAFIKTKAGTLSLKKSLIETDNINDAWMNIKVPLPSVDEQQVIASALEKSTKLSEEILNLKESLIDNPEKSKEIDDELTDWIKKLDKLSIEDKVANMVSDGESDTVEFKQTLSLDVKKQTKEKYIENSVLKTIAGFLNSKGGVLLIGVSDNCKILGISAEVEKIHKNSTDKFLQHFRNIFKSSIGAEYYPLARPHIVDIQGAKILLVDCKRTPNPCFVNGKDFYVRTNPATDKLEGKEQFDYINIHFMGNNESS